MWPRWLRAAQQRLLAASSAPAQPSARAAARPHRAGPRQRALMQELEPRLLHSADSPAAWLPCAVLPAAVVPAAVVQVVPTDTVATAATAATGATAATFAPAVQAAAAPQASAALQAAHELVFIDAAVVHTQALISGLQAARPEGTTLEIVLLQTGQDGLQQISATLAQHTGVSAVHIVAHGEQAALQLGSTRLDAAALQARAAELQAWRAALTGDADLLLYGCNVAAGDTGAAFVQNLARLTEADVAASTNATGAAAAGGDWVLEAQVGQVTSQPAVVPTLQQALSGVLGLTPQGAEVRVNSNTAGTQITPLYGGGAVAMDNAGNHVVAWADDRTNAGDVYFQRYNAAGVAQGGNVLVNTTTSNVQIDANIAMDPTTGSFVVIWTSDVQDGGTAGLYGQRFSSAGVALGAEFKVNTTSASQQSQPTVAMAPGGAFVVAWVDDSSGDSEVRAQRFDAGGNKLGGEIAVNTSSTGTQAYPSLAMDSSGKFVVLWEGNQTSDYNVYGRRFSAAGVALGGEFQANTYSSSTQWNVAVAASSAGDFVAVWESEGQDPDASKGIYGQRFNASGVAQGAEFRVNTTTADLQVVPAVAMDASGGFVVGWTSNLQDGSGNGIYAQAFDAAANPLGGEQQVPTTTSLEQLNSAVGTAGSQVVVAWNGNGSGDNQGVFARQFQLADYGQMVVDTTSDAADGDASSISALYSNKGADGFISLREAITAANNTANGTGGPDRIHFSIAGAGPHVITPGSALPSVTDAVVIDATTSADFTANGNQPIVVLDGNNLVAKGLVLAAGSGGSTVRGLVVRDFGSDAIQLLAGSDGNTLVGNYIGRLNTSGGDAGVAESNTGVGVLINSANNRVGGATLADRNVISGNNSGVHIEGAGATGNWVSGNTIGTDAAGTLDLGNTLNGVSIYGGAANNTIGTNLDGTTDANEGNLISGNNDTGVQLGAAGSGNTVRGNLIGVDASATAVLGNGNQGIQIFGGTSGTLVGGTNPLAANVVGGSGFRGIEIAGVGSTGNVVQGNFVGTNSAGLLSLPNGGGIGLGGGAAGNTVGGIAAGSGNVVAFNSGIGIDVTDSGVNNTLMRNLVHDNGALGIDLGLVGITANDANDADTGANDLQNTPVLASANTYGGNTTVTGSLNSNASTNYRIEFFSAPSGDASGHGEAAVYLGAASVSTDGSGNASIVVVITGANVAAGHVVSATATVDQGAGSFGSTSELAANTTTTSVAPGIRVGALSGNTSEAGATATFTVVLDTAPLADVTVPVSSSNTLEGTVSTSLLTFTSANWNMPQTVTVTGQNETLDDGNRAYTLVLGAASSADTAYSGINPADVAASNTDDDTLNTLQVTTSSDTADGDTSSLYALLANPGADGAVSLREAITAANNTTNGSGADVIAFNIAGAGPHSISPVGTALPTLADATVIDGTTQAGAVAGSLLKIVLDGNNLAAAGLTLGAGADGSTVRGLVIRDFGADGIVVQAGSDGNTIAGNFIGRLDGSGGDAGAGEGNASSGLYVLGANNTIGGTVAADRNVISGNILAGVGLYLGAATGNAVAGNLIGLAADGSTLLGNGTAGVRVLDGASNNTIGGNTVAHRNVIAGNATAGVQVGGSGVSSGNLVRGNYIGSDSSGTLDRGNGQDGVHIGNAAASNQIINNLIAANDGDGIELGDVGASTGTVVQGNLIGTAANGSSALGNSGHGVLVGNGGTADGTLIGGTGGGQGNTVAFNGGDGVYVAASTAVAVVGNEIQSNAGLAIDLGTDGVTANDAGDADSGANNLQNFPVLTSARTDAASQLVLTGSLDAATNSFYRIEFFASTAADASGHGEGQRYLGFSNVSTDGAGLASISASLAVAVAAGERISATATSSDAGFTVWGSSSEFALNATAALVPVVTTSGTSLAVTENDPATAVDPALTVTDGDSATLASASVSITGNYASGEDVLLFTNQLGITGSWNAGSGVLSLTGSASPADYQSALRSVAYVNTSDNPSTATRTVSFAVDDGGLVSDGATRDVTLAAVNDAPVITSNGGAATAAVTVPENTNAVTVVTVSDGDGATPIYSIIGGADAAKFVVDSATGALGFMAAPNFEAPGDVGADNVYNVTLQVSDGAGGTDTQAVSVTVTDVAEQVVTGNSSSARASGAATLSWAHTVDNGLNRLLIVNVAVRTDVPVVSVSYGASALTLVGTQVDVTGKVRAEMWALTAPAVGTANVVVTLVGSARFTAGASDFKFVDQTTPFSAVVTGTGVGNPVLAVPSAAGRLVVDAVADRDVSSEVVGAGQGVLWTNKNGDGSSDAWGGSSVEAGAALTTLSWTTTGGVAGEWAGVAVSLLAQTNVPPVITSNGAGASAAVSLSENSTAVTTVQASDANLPAQTLTYAISGGADQARFAIHSATGALSFAVAPNFEAPADVGGNNVYDVVVQVSDGNGGIDSQALAVSVINVNEAPLLVTTGSTLAYAENDAATAVDSGLTVSDVDSATLASASVSITGNYASGQDVLSFTNQLGISGSWNAGTGVLTLTGGATAADYQTALRSVAYSNTSDAPSVLPRTLSFVADDGVLSSAAATRNISVTAVNDAPSVSTSGSTLTVAENSAATPVDSGLVLADVDSPTLSGASVSLSAGYVNGQDLLLFTDQLGVSGSWNASTGVLTLAGSASVADYQTALRSVSYLNNSEAPDVSLRTLRFDVSDGALSSAAATRFLQATAVNDAPVLDNSGAMLLTTIARTDNTNAGNTVAQVIGSVSGDRIVDVDAAALEGLAVSATASAGLGAWEFSLDAGSTWQAVGVVANNAALLLRDTDRVRFVPSGAANGQASFSFHAWDQSSGVAGTKVDASTAGGTQPFSMALETATLNVVENTGGPVAVDDAAQTQVGVPVPVSVTANDLDPQGNPLAVLDVSNPANGTLAVAGNTITYTPSGGFSGFDTFNYLVSDGNEGLTHYWKLDGDAVDNVGAGNGTLMNGPATVAGAYGSALQFDGVDDHVVLPDLVYTNEFSLSFRFRVDDNNGSQIQYFYSHGPSPNSGLRGMVHVGLVEASNAVLVQRNSLITTVFDNNDAADGSGQVLVDVAALIGDGQWHQYTATVTPGIGTRVYVDGALRGSVNRGGDAIDPTGAAYLGIRSDLDPTRYLNAGGRMDGLALFNRALSASEVADWWTGGNALATVSVQVNAVPVVATSGGSTSYTENAAATAVDIGLTVVDANNATLAGAVVSISSNYLAGQDQLQFSNQLGITGSWNVGTGELTLSGNASVADYQTALRSVAYVNSSDAPSALVRGVQFVVNDGLVNSAAAAQNISVSAVNDAPTASNLNSSENYTEDTPLNLVDIVISDLDSASGSATLTLSNAAAGVLSTGTSGAVTATYNAGSGVWAASGALVDVNSLLSSVTFTPASNFNGAFSIGTSVSDGVAAAVNGNKAMSGVPVNDAPTASNLSAAQTYTEDTPLALLPIVVADVDSATVTVTLTLSDAAAGSLNTDTSGAVSSSYGVGTGVWSASGALADVNNLLAALVFTPAANYTSAFSITTSVSDGVAVPATGGKNMGVTLVNDAPTASNLNAAEAYTEDLPLNLTDTVVSDVDSASVSVSFTLSSAAAGALSTATAGAVTSSFNPATGVWAASGALADVNTLLAALVFTPAADFNGSFSISTSVGDGVTAPITGSKLFTGTPVNDAPSASNLGAPETYTEDTPLNLVDIVVADVDSASGSATLVLSNVAAGTLSTGTAGAATASYNPASGVWTVSGAWVDVNSLLAALVFTPTANFNGGFSISTNVSDGVAAPISGSKVFTGAPVNDAPTASNLNAAEAYTEDMPLNLADTVVSDVDSAAVSVSFTLSDAAAGSLATGSAGAVTSSFNPATGVWLASGALADVNTLLAALVFTPAANFNAGFSINTSVSDGVAAPTTGSKLFTGTPVNDAPSASNLGAAEIYTEDLPLNLTDIVAADVDSANLTVTLTLADSSVGALSVGRAGAVTATFNASTGVWSASGALADVNTLLAALTFTPAPDSNGAFTLATQVDDGVAAPITGVKNFSALAVNDAPVASGLNTAEAYTEDTPRVLGPIVISDVDSASGSATLTLSNPARGSLSTASAGAASSTYNGATGVWTASGAWVDLNTLLAAVRFVPAPDFNGSFSISTSVSDGLAATLLGRKDFTGVAVNDAPTATGLNTPQTYTEDTPLNLDAWVVSDVDSATAAVTATVTLTLSDPLVGSLNTATVAGTTSSYDATAGVWTASGALTDVNSLLAALVFTPALNFNGNFMLHTQVSDGVAAPITGNRVFTGVAANDSPVLTVNAGLQVLEASGTPITSAQLSATDVDNTAAGLVYTLVNAPAHGWLARSGARLTPGTGFTQADLDAGRVAYHHDGSETTADAFDVNLADALGGQSLANPLRIGVAVTPVNDETPQVTTPLAASTGAVIAMPENTRPGTTITTVTASDADLPAQTLQFQIAGGADAAFFSIDASTGDLRFIGSADFEQPLDADHNNLYQLDLRVDDGALSSIHSITVAVTPVNDNAPQIVSAGAQPSAGVEVQEGGIAVITVVGSDADRPASALLYSITGGADAALFAIDPSSGALRFVATPAAADARDSDHDNVYEVVVRASDGALSAQQALRVLVRAAVVAGQPLNPVTPGGNSTAPPPYTGDGEPPKTSPTSPLQPPVTAPLPAVAEEPGLALWQGESTRTARSFKLLEQAGSNRSTDPLLDAQALWAQAADAPGAGAAPGSYVWSPDSDTPSLEAALGLPTNDPGLLQVRPGGLSLAALAAQAAARSSTAVPSGLAPTGLDGEGGAGDNDDSVISAIATPVMAGGLAFSATLLVWASRAGGLMAAMMASVPAWRSLDPLPILERRQADDGDDDLADPATDDPTQNMGEPARHGPASVAMPAHGAEPSTLDAVLAAPIPTPVQRPAAVEPARELLQLLETT